MFAQRLGLPRLDAQLLLLHALEKPASERAWLIAHDETTLLPAATERFRLLATRRAAGEPLAYLVGHQEFFGLRLAVDKRVLIPRPDTETLVQWALDLLPAIPAEAPQSAPVRIVDLGTGSGAVILALAHSLRQRNRKAILLAVDSSAAALTVARTNHVSLSLATTGHAVQFIHSDWFDSVPGMFDLIVSNPPYIASDDAHLADLTHEPLQALAAGPDGLRDLRHLVDTSAQRLNAGGWLLLEHGYEQAGAVRELMIRRGFLEVRTRPDLAGRDRCTGGRWPV